MKTRLNATASMKIPKCNDRKRSKGVRFRPLRHSEGFDPSDRTKRNWGKRTKMNAITASLKVKQKDVNSTERNQSIAVTDRDAELHVQTEITSLCCGSDFGSSSAGSFEGGRDISCSSMDEDMTQWDRLM